MTPQPKARKRVTDKERLDWITCKGRTHGPNFPYPEGRCSRNPWKDGYCRQHHPQERSLRSQARMDEKDRLRQKASEAKGLAWVESHARCGHYKMNLQHRADGLFGWETSWLHEQIKIMQQELGAAIQAERSRKP